MSPYALVSMPVGVMVGTIGEHIAEETWKYTDERSGKEVAAQR